MHFATTNLRSAAGLDFVSAPGRSTPRDFCCCYGFELCDKKFVKDLEGEFSGFAEESFKDLRRALPYSGQKMNWSSDSHSMAKELKRREDELAAQEQQPAGEPGAGES